MESSNFVFDKMSRIGVDEIDTTNRTIQNTQASSYMLENYLQTMPLKQTRQLAMSQPNIFYNGSPKGGINGNFINESSVLQISNISKPKERVELQQRLFSTVPYLGKGPSNPVIESFMQHGDINLNKKSLDPNSELLEVILVSNLLFHL